MWTYLRTAFRTEGVLAERLTERLNPGVPDVLWTFEGRTGLLELKWLPAFPTDRTVTPLLTYGAHGLQPDQAFWLGRWARRGGRAHVLLRIGTDDWWLWTALPTVVWTGAIRTTWANTHPTHVWDAETFNTRHLVRCLCG